MAILHDRGSRQYSSRLIDPTTDHERVGRDRHRARPIEDASLLGRVLATLGAPVGPKAEHHLPLPPCLDDAPATARETFVYAHLENRATEHEGKRTLTV